MAEPRQYTTGEIAKLSALTARAAGVIARGRSTAKVDAAIRRVQEQACAREKAAEQAAKKREQERLQKRAERRARRWV